MSYIQAILSAIGILQYMAPEIDEVFKATLALLNKAFGGSQNSIEAGLQKAANLVEWAEDNEAAIESWAQALGVDIKIVGTQLASLGSPPNGQPLSASGMTKLLYVAYNLAADLKVDMGTAISMAQDAWKLLSSAEAAATEQSAT